MMHDKLKSLADRIGRLMDDADGIKSDIRDIYVEAKSTGYVPKLLRKAITRKRMDASKRDEEDAILDLYEDALGAVGKAVAAVRAGSTWKEAVEEHNVKRATLARAVKSQKQQTDTDRETASGNPPDESAGTPDVTSRAGSALVTNSDAAPKGNELSPVTPQTGEGSSVTPVPDEGVKGLAPFDPGPLPSRLDRRVVVRQGEHRGCSVTTEGTQ